MPFAPLSVIDRSLERSQGHAVLDPSDYPINLLPVQEREGSHLAKVVLGSLVFHVLFLLLAIRLPSFVAPHEPEPRVIVHRVPLYLPRDVLTQKTPNKREVSKRVDLADLMSQQSQRAQKAAPERSVKRFELPKAANVKKPSQNTPQILPTAPSVAVSQAPAAMPLGSNTGLASAPPPPTPSNGPFQNIGTEAPPPAHPKIAAPKASVETAINGLTQHQDGSHVIVTDDSSAQPAAPTPGVVGQLGAQHAGVELKSDPEGVDMRPYLAHILAIVRANWRRVIPDSVRLGTLRGRTVVEFIINRDGSIPKLVTAESSGLEPLDRAAVAGLSMSNPLPPLPAEYKGFQVRLAFSFTYNMPSP